MSFSLGGDDTKIKQTLELFEKFDKLILDSAFKNREKWFNDSDLTMDVLKKFYRPIVRRSKKKRDDGNEYHATVRTRLFENKDGSFAVNLFLKEENEENKGVLTKQILTKQNYNLFLPKGSKGRPIIRNTGIWISDGKFGVGWQLSQLLIYPNQQLDECAFSDGVCLITKSFKLRLFTFSFLMFILRFSPLMIILINLFLSSLLIQLFLLNN